MTRPLGTGAGRATGKPRKVDDVQRVECPAGGLHVLRNDRAGRTTCAGCGEPWATLDARVRGGAA